MEFFEQIEPVRAGGLCVLVPTMGFLHEGHVELVKLGVQEAQARDLPGGCVVSLFVNPSQFNETRDFDIYPRELERDLALCEGAGAQAVFAPAEHVMYPVAAGNEIRWPQVPGVGRLPKLEEVGRPGHFEGVCRVLVRLFELVPTAAAIFGQKDFQQLQLARALVEQEEMGVQIIGAETFREHDGLAMSSRNVHLSEQGRTQARAISQALRAARAERVPDAGEQAMQRVLTEAGIERVEYATIRRARDLMAFEPGEAGRVEGRALVTAYVDNTRLLDNMPWAGRLMPESVGQRLSLRLAAARRLAQN